MNRITKLDICTFYTVLSVNSYVYPCTWYDWYISYFLLLFCFLSVHSCYMHTLIPAPVCVIWLMVNCCCNTVISPVWINKVLSMSLYLSYCQIWHIATPVNESCHHCCVICRVAPGAGYLSSANEWHKFQSSCQHEGKISTTKQLFFTRDAASIYFEFK